MIGHDDKVCVAKDKDLQAGEVKNNQYGTWLRASPVKAFRRSETRKELSPEISSSDKGSHGHPRISGSDLLKTGISGGDKYGRRRLDWEANSGREVILGVNEGVDDKDGHLFPMQDRSVGNHASSRCGKQNSNSGNKISNSENSNSGDLMKGNKNYVGYGMESNESAGLVDVEVNWKSNNIEFMTEDQRQEWEVAERNLARVEGLNESWLAEKCTTFSSQASESVTLRTIRRRGKPQGSLSKANKNRLHVKPKEGALYSKGINPSLAEEATKIGRKWKVVEGVLSIDGEDIEVTSPMKKQRIDMGEVTKDLDSTMVDSGHFVTVEVASRVWPQVDK